jgi:hypothetical protein
MECRSNSVKEKEQFLEFSFRFSLLNYFINSNGKSTFFTIITQRNFLIWNRKECHLILMAQTSQQITGKFNSISTYTHTQFS